MTQKKQGVAVIREALKTMPEHPGVYRMINLHGEVLYVGKALNLRKRVASYTAIQRLPERLCHMVELTVALEVVVTATEAEALLLEANYIKRMQPRFNILLKDDKTYPWLVITGTHAFPRLVRQRGQVKKGSFYWGPFASTKSVEETIHILQKIFLLRSCTDSEFSSRVRPCLLYQIKRCSGPCVGRISKQEYAQLVEQACEFLQSGVGALQKRLTRDMEKASEEMAFERAALIRDRIRGLASLRSSNVINPTHIIEADVLAIWQASGMTCIQVFFIRGGHNNGHRVFYPTHEANETAESILEAFLMQFYEDKIPPSQIIMNCSVLRQEVIEEALSLRREKKVRCLIPRKGARKDVLEHALLNAREALERRIAENMGQKELCGKLVSLFHLPAEPHRIEVYDNSHLMGHAPYGAMIVAGPEGFIKSAYRKFSIRESHTPGDDYGMMREVMRRRFRGMKRGEKEEGHWPDLLLIDGGKGQVHAVRSILEEMNLSMIPVVGIAKGVERYAGREWFFVEGREPFQLPKNDSVLYYLQRLRDEVHRFAITAHRSGRTRALTRSSLDAIDGVGPVRKKALLARFGSVRHIQNAALEELMCVPGINREMAQVIYGYFHSEWLRRQSVASSPAKEDT